MTMDANQIWQRALEKLRRRVSPAAYDQWCLGSSGQSLIGNHLIVSVPSPFASGVQRQRFQEQVRIAVSEVMGERAEVTLVLPPLPMYSSRLVVDSHETDRAEVSAVPEKLRMPPRSQPRHNRRPQIASRVARAYPVHDQAPGRGTGASKVTVGQPALPLSLLVHPRPKTAPDSQEAYDLHPRYAFETFVIGAANQLACAAAQEVASHPGEQYNPLLLYGGPGLGKTHLLQAIGHRTRQSGLAVAYVTAERFANEIIEAIRQHSTDKFRTRYRAVDVLLVDDIEFIAGKESTEEEFFHTFNALHEASKQIVLTSDRVPQAMRHLHDRLRSRFQWGLIADIDSPNFSHRLAILRAKAATLPIQIPEEVLLCLARPECESIRALEGSLNRVVASAQMLGQPVDTRLAAWTVAPLAIGPIERTAEDIIEAVARYFGMATAALKGASRERAVAWARQIAMYLLREETSASLFQIGQQLGGRDHTTVLHGCQKVDQAMARNELARTDISAIRAALRR
jgi:chromosomal replication initiator protein